MYESVERKLREGGTVILDGGTGTDLQRRGVPMDDAVWCAMANLSHGDVVRAVHRDYIDAGAEVITANTYASSPLSFASIGREGEIEGIDRTAVRLARSEADGRGVAVAGSISVMPAVARGLDRNPDPAIDAERLLPLYRKKAATLADAGCDLLIMEMMRDLDVSLWATEAAVATGLPVWVGLTVERSDDGRLLSYANRRWSLAELVRGLMATGAHAALIMHHEIPITEPALQIMREHFPGPIGAYPEAGHFEMPDWIFEDIEPAEFAEASVRWRAAGARMIGGCCGTTPSHIDAVARRLRA